MSVNPEKLPEHFVFPTLHCLRGAGAGFDLGDFAAREQRRVERLVRAAYGVGHTQPEFLNMTRPAQEKMVRLWVDEALESREIRLGQVLPR